MILLSTGLLEEEEEPVEDLAGLVGEGEGEGWWWCCGGMPAVETWSFEGRWCRGKRGDVGRADEEDGAGLDGPGEGVWHMAATRFCVRTVVLEVELREVMGGRRARDDLSGVPCVLPSARGRGESRRMDAGEEGRAPDPDAVRFMASLAVSGGKPAVTGDGAPPDPVKAAALRKRPMSWLACRSARVWAIMSRKSTPTPNESAL